MARKTNDGSSVLQNRVVPTPVAGAKPRGGEVELDRARSAANPLTTVARKSRSPGRARSKP